MIKKEKTPKIFNEPKESHLSQWMEGPAKPPKSPRQILKVFSNFSKRLAGFLVGIRVGFGEFIKQRPRLKIVGIAVAVLMVIGISIGFGVSIGGRKHQALVIPDELMGEPKIIGEIEKELSQQFQGIADEEFQKTDYKYAVYIKLIKTETGEKAGSLLEVYPVTANSWDKLFRQEREEILEKFVKLYKKYINKKSGQIHIRNNVQILAEAIWGEGKKLEVEIKR